MDYQKWKIINESFGGFTLGLGRNSVVSGVVGAQLGEDFKDDELDDELEDETSDELEDSDLGPEKSFPPDDSEEMDGLPTPDKEMIKPEDDDFEGDPTTMSHGDFSTALSKHMGSPMSPQGPVTDEPNKPEDDDFEGDPTTMNHGDFSAALSKHMGSPMPPQGPVTDEPDMDFLNDIDIDMAGLPDGDASAGDPVEDMPVDDAPVDDMAPEDEAGEDEFPDFEFDLDGEESDEELDAAPAKQFMSKGAPCMNCESTQDSAWQKYCKTRFTEDALIEPAEVKSEDPKAGAFGFAPMGRIGSIGGGYTQDDIQSIPTIGEGTKFPTLEEYIASKKKS